MAMIAAWLIASVALAAAWWLACELRERRVEERMQEAGTGELKFFYEKACKRLWSRNDGMVLVVLRDVCTGIPAEVGRGDYLSLEMARGFAVPTPVEFIESGIRTRLMFRGVEYDVFIPWPAIMRARPVNPPGGGGRPGWRKAA